MLHHHHRHHHQSMCADDDDSSLICFPFRFYSLRYNNARKGRRASDAASRDKKCIAFFTIALCWRTFKRPSPHALNNACWSRTIHTTGTSMRRVIALALFSRIFLVKVLRALLIGYETYTVLSDLFIYSWENPLGSNFKELGKESEEVNNNFFLFSLFIHQSVSLNFFPIRAEWSIAIYFSSFLFCLNLPCWLGTRDQSRVSLSLQ